MSTSPQKSIYLLAYVPVIQRSYLNFFARYPDAKLIGILGQDILAQFDWLRKDIRSLTPQHSAIAVAAVLREDKNMTTVSVLYQEDIAEILSATQVEESVFILPNEDIMQQFADTFLSQQEVVFEDVFLRWEKNNTLAAQPVSPNSTIKKSDFEQQVMNDAFRLAALSGDWWRQVGAILTKNKQVVLTAFNQHVPDQYQTLFQGDPRGNFKKGIYLELTTAFHAEAMIIAAAAKNGVSLAGAELFVTTFPCPNCAKLIAYSGIQKLYFVEGYSLVDGESILKEKKVEIIQLLTSSSQS